MTICFTDASGTVPASIQVTAGRAGEQWIWQDGTAQVMMLSVTDTELPSQAYVNGSSILTGSIGDTRYVMSDTGFMMLGPQASVLNWGDIALGASARVSSGGYGGWGLALGCSAHVNGYESLAVGNCASEGGDDSASIGTNALAWGNHLLALGASARNYSQDAAVVVGYGALTECDEGSTALGCEACAEADYVTAVGYQAQPRSEYSTAISCFTSTDWGASFSVASAPYATAYGIYSVAAGPETVTEGDYQFVVGINNVPLGITASGWNPTDPLFIIGNGGDEWNGGQPSNAFVVNKNGDTTVGGAVVVGGTSGNQNVVVNGGWALAGTQQQVQSGTTYVPTMVATDQTNLMLAPQQGSSLPMGPFVGGPQPPDQGQSMQNLAAQGVAVQAQNETTQATSAQPANTQASSPQPLGIRPVSVQQTRQTAPR
jgi:hypothetical protein